MNRIDKLHNTLARAVPAGLFVLVALPADATITISDTPLFLTVSVPPNIVLTLDDSGSMRRAFVPENCLADTSDCDHLDNRYEKSAYRNLIYYNPSVKYSAPKNAAGTFLTTTFTSAYRNGFDTAFGTRNLSNGYMPTAYLDLNGSATEAYMGHYASDFQCNTASNKCQYMNEAGTWVDIATNCSGANATAKHNFCRGTHSSGLSPVGMPAYYYVFDSTNASCNGTDTDNDCYDIKFVSATSGPGTLDLNGDGVINATDKDERQNFANWYSFARTRNLTTATGASLAFATLDSSARVAWQALNSCRGSTSSLVDTDCDGWKANFAGISNAIRPFSGSHKTNFYSWIMQNPTNSGTPLGEALERVGEYFKTSGDNSPYDDDYTAAGSTETSCRRNYHILMTDGIWTVAGTKGNTDGANQTFPDNTAYAPADPYSDAHSNTLADSAFYYWKTDLRGTLNDNLTAVFIDQAGTPAQKYQNPRNDPATWQHMVNYTIGLGLTGYLADAGMTWTGDMFGGSYANIANNTLQWPQPSTTANDPDNVADLWHAAINSRGKFFSADDPAGLAAAFTSALTAITANSGSAAALSANSTSIQAGTVVYQAKFNSSDWSGTLLALPVAGDGSIGAANWDASTLIPAHALRNIFTHNGTGGAVFNACANLSASQQTLLATGGVTCANRLAWLRGDATNEIRNGGTLRNRLTTVMADIVNSDPYYVKDTNYGHEGLPAGTPGQANYAAYVTANAGRQAMVYVGTNSGMLEAINADTGAEVFAYVPSGVYGNLATLTDTPYSHRFYVDGAPVAGDAYLGGVWKTVLVGGLNGGGKSIYALDVTDPTGFNATKVLWEYTETDMGSSYSQPQIGILESGQWVAIFGNGYNSTGGGSHLYVVNLADGTLIRKITALDAAGDDSNGLSTPVLYDSDANGKIDTVYAGDLQGYLWKFDLSNAASASWGVAYAGSPLYRACRDDDSDGIYCEAGEQQPITAQPKATGHTLGGHMVVFGTGRYLTATDVNDASVQTFYGIRDNGTVVADRTQLQQQSVTAQTTSFGFDVRSVSTNAVDWATKKGWYLNLPDTPGERVVSAALIKESRAIFVTLVPSTDPCTPGGYSWLMEVDLLTGGQTEPVFDLNNDGTYDALAGVKSTVGISKTPVWLDKDDATAFKEMTGTSGGFMAVKNKKTPPPGGGGGTVQRTYWMQIR